jgi:hypothetical protein
VIKCRIFRWAGHVARMEEGRCAFTILTGKPTRKRPLEMLGRRWEDNIGVDLKEIGMNKGNGLIRLRIRIIGEPCECGNEPPGSISYSEHCRNYT